MYSLIFIGILTIGRSVYFLNSQFISEHIHESLRGINYIPFRGMLNILFRVITGSVYALANFFGNIFMFILFGFCVALLSQKEKRTKYTVLAGAGVSLIIEIIQFFYKRNRY